MNLQIYILNCFQFNLDGMQQKRFFLRYEFEPGPTCHHNVKHFRVIMLYIGLIRPKVQTVVNGLQI